MKALIINYTDWIGYHIVEALLCEGFDVEGKALDTGNEILAGFFARNAHFSEYKHQEEETFDIVIAIEESSSLKHIHADKIFLINHNEKLDGVTTIHTGIMFGEWMPMNELSFYHQGKKITFDSKQLKEEGIYIGDFISIFMNWVKVPNIEGEIILSPERNQRNITEKLDNLILVKENMNIEDKVQEVIAHYKQFEALYPDFE